jgi:hypothetical protein
VFSKPCDAQQSAQQKVAYLAAAAGTVPAGTWQKWLVRLDVNINY